MAGSLTYGDFFRNAPQLNQNRKMITGVVCGVRSIDVKSQRIEYRKSVENKGFPGVGACQRTGFGSRILSFYG